MKKFKLLGSISVLILSIACLAFGVYSATTASFSMSGNVSFTATSIYAKIEGQVYHGATEDFVPTDTGANANKVAGSSYSYVGYNYIGVAGTSSSYSAFGDGESEPVENSKWNIGTIEMDENYSRYIKIVLKFTNMTTGKDANILVSNENTINTLSEKLSISQGWMSNPSKVALNSTAEYVITIGINNFAQSITASDFEENDMFGSLSFDIEEYEVPELTYQSGQYEYQGLTFGGIDSQNKTIKLTDGHASTKSIIVIPSEVRILENSKNASDVADVYSVIELGDTAFPGMLEITNVVIPDSVETLGYMLFYLDSKLKYVVMSNNLKTIKSYAFNGCRELKTIQIPDSVTAIGSGAFCSTGITSIVIPAGMTNIVPGSEFSFVGFEGLDSIEVSANNQKYYSETNCVIERTTKKLVAAAKNFVIPNDVTSIGDNAVSYFRGLTEVTIPSSVTSIGDFAFYNCSNLTTITFTGTIAQWNAIYKGEYWAFAVIATQVSCSDGIATIS